jgi:hypothetical protein
VFSILSRAVLSQSTQPAEPIGFLVRVAKPLALSGATPKSMSLYSQPFLSITSSAFVGEGGSLPFCILIIAHIRLFVKHFFNFLRKSWDLNPLGIASHFTAGTISPPIEKLFLFFGGNGGACPSKSKVRAELHRLTAFPKSLAVPIPLDFVPLLYHNLGDLSRGFR